MIWQLASGCFKPVDLSVTVTLMKNFNAITQTVVNFSQYRWKRSGDEHIDFDNLRTYLTSTSGDIEGFPFDRVTLALKVGRKKFSLINTNGDPLRINLKCEPGKAQMLRELHPCVISGYHMDKSLEHDLSWWVSVRPGYLFNDWGLI